MVLVEGAKVKMSQVIIGIIHRCQLRQETWNVLENIFAHVVIRAPLKMALTTGIAISACSRLTSTIFSK